MALSPLTTELHCYGIGKSKRLLFGRGVTYMLGMVLEVNLSVFYVCAAPGWFYFLSSIGRVDTLRL